jgi:hypothetical protein
MDTQAIQAILQNIRYPISKGELIQLAEKRGANKALPALQELPDQTFESAGDIMDNLPALKTRGGMGDLDM